MRIFRLFLTVILMLAISAHALAASQLKLQKVANNVYAIVGDLGNRTPENFGNNATFGFVVTDDGVVLIDSGGTYKGAEEINKVIRQVTSKPVKIVINTGGQDHRWLGNGYFKKLGAKIIASSKAVEDQKARVQDQLSMLRMLVGAAGLEGTNPVYADETFGETLTFESGKTVFNVIHAGHAHTPGDSFVWLPKQRVVFAGDIIFVERMLGVQEHSKSSTWIKSFEAIQALKPAAIVPGHGHVTNLKRAKADTYDYLVFLRNAVGKFMKDGGSIADVGKIDQSKFSYLKNYDTLKGRNAQQVYSEMQWE